MEQFNNSHGLAFTARSPLAVDAFDNTVRSYLSFDRATGAALKTIFAADVEMPMARCLHGYFYMLMGIRALVDKARQLALQLEQRMEQCNPRERMHIQALLAWSNDSLAGATAAWDRISIEYPRDILALKMAHFGYFYLGDSRAIRDGIARAMDFWTEGDDEYAYMASMYAFGLVECGDLVQAELLGRDAIARQPADPWGVHAVAHALETTNRKGEAIGWIDAHMDHWRHANNFRYHIAWHKALLRFENGDYEQALVEYDTNVSAVDATEYLDICNEASLLLRLELAGIEVGDRWRAIADKAAPRVNERVVAFADIHYVIALASSPDPDHHELARRMVDLMDEYSKTDLDNALAYRLSALPVARAVLAFRDGRYAEAATGLLEAESRIALSGGSHDQRDVFALLIAEALHRTDRGGMRTVAYLAARSRSAPHSRHNWRLYLDALAVQGDMAALTVASERSKRAFLSLN